MTIERMRGPWRAFNLSRAANLLGVSDQALHNAARHGRIATNPGCRSRLSWSELRRYLSTPACWVLVHPREIADDELREIATAAWDAAGAPRFYASADLCQHYYISTSTLCRWRDRGWPNVAAWHWQGGRRGAGNWWLVWSGPLPPPIEKSTKEV